MIRRTITLGVDDLSSVRGALVCRDLALSTAAGPASIRRGKLVDDALLAELAQQTGARLEVAMPEPGEIEQGEASRRFARAIVGNGLAVDAPHQGQCVVHAAASGLLRVCARPVVRINRRDTILLATALDGRVVDVGDTVAIVKAARLWTSAEDLERSLRAAGAERLLHVTPFAVQRAAFLAGPRIRPPNFKLAAENLRGLLAGFDVDLSVSQRIPEDPASIAAAYGECLAAGAEIILIGGSIVLDPTDPFLTALGDVDGRVTVRGAPIDPGTMFWVAYARATVLFGLASCELYGRRSILDLLLPYAVARETIDSGLLAELGYGGLLDQTFDARRRPSAG